MDPPVADAEPSVERASDAARSSVERASDAAESSVRLASDAAEPSVRLASYAELAERSQQMLAFERRWWRHAGAKEQAIQDTFGLSPTRYYQLLNRLLDEPAALAHDPVLVARLRRLRASRTRYRPR